MNVSHLFLFTVNAPQNVTNLMTFFCLFPCYFFCNCLYLFDVFYANFAPSICSAVFALWLRQADKTEWVFKVTLYISCFPLSRRSKLILNSEVHEVALTLSRQPAGFLSSVVCLFVLLPQDISAHESNILGSFCDMNVSGRIYFSMLFSFCPQTGPF